MADFVGSPTNENSWTKVGRSNRDRNQWASNAPKQANKSQSWGKPIAASPLPPKSKSSPMKQDANTWEQPKETPDWGTTPAVTNPNPWATEPAPVDVNWGDMESSLIPAPQEEWVYQDPDAPLELTSLNLAAYCSPVDDWNIKMQKSRQYHQLKKQERIIQWVMEGTEEVKPPSLHQEDVRRLWKPFSNRSPHVLPGAYS